MTATFEIVDLARRRLCGQASSATSEQCLLKSGADHLQEETTIDSQSRGRRQFVGMALQRQWLGRIIKEAPVCSTGGRRKA